MGTADKICRHACRTERNGIMAVRKSSGITVRHCCGLKLPKDFPCRIMLTRETFTITHVKPKMVIMLPVSRINSFSAMEEEKYMLKYMGETAASTKSPTVKKYYLVVDYKSKNGGNKQLVFWGTDLEYTKFIEFQHTPLDLENHRETIYKF